MFCLYRRSIKQDWKIFQLHRLRNKWQILKIYYNLISAWQLLDNCLMTAWWLTDDCLKTAWRQFKQSLACLYVQVNVSYVMEFLAWWVLKSKVSTQKSTVVKWNCCILWIDIEWGLQKLDLILESKVVQKSSLEKKMFFNKKGSPKLIFLDEIFFLKKFGWFLT